MRRGDVSAALSRETSENHATGKAAEIAKLPVSQDPVVAARVERALERLDEAKVIAILRTKSEERAVARARELADMGYRAIEVTADSAGFSEGTLMPSLVKAVGDRVLVGCGTITRIDQLELAAEGGAHFALSPVCPTVGWEHTAGFVQECHKRGVLAMPAAFTPQEIYQCVDGFGAKTVKIFPAQLWNPGALKDLRRIGDFGSIRLCPSGGISCSNAEAWLAAGACAVGMGGSLTGKDIATDPNDAEAMKAAETDWASSAQPAAAKLAETLGLAGRDSKKRALDACEVGTERVVQPRR